MINILANQSIHYFAGCQYHSKIIIAQCIITKGYYKRLNIALLNMTQQICNTCNNN